MALSNQLLKDLKIMEQNDNPIFDEKRFEQLAVLTSVLQARFDFRTSSPAGVSLS